VFQPDHDVMHWTVTDIAHRSVTVTRGSLLVLTTSGVT